MPSEHDRELGAINAKLDFLIEGFKLLEPRLRNLEHFRAKLLGLSIAITIFVSAAVSWVTENVSFSGPASPAHATEQTGAP